MAQTSIRSYYPVKRKREDHASIKRRKLTEDTRLDIPITSEHSDPTSISLTQHEKVTTTPKQTVSVRKSTRSITKKGSSKGKKRDGPSVHSPFDCKSKHSSAPVLQTSPVKSPMQGLSRGATLVRLAQEKEAIQLSENVDEIERVLTMPARRKLLLNPEAKEPKLQDKTKKQLSKEEMISELYKMSAKELANPTQIGKNMPICKPVRKSKLIESEDQKLRKFSSFKYQSPVKKSKPPAYERFHGLAEPSTPTQSPTKHHDPEKLPLPFTYQVLLEKFHSTDTVTTMLQKRKEICTFSKLKKAVQEMTRKQFEKRNLAQMKTVFPSAYVFRQEKNIPGIYDRSEYAKYQLTIECNANNDGATDEDKMQFGPTALIKRKKVFQTNLTDIVKKHHKNFLAGLKPPLDIPDDKVMRWHPAFPLDTVPEVEESELPKPPVTDTYMTAQDVLQATQGQLPSRVQTALSNVAASGTTKEAKCEENKKKEHVDVDPLLRGVSSSLLDKIRAKEAAKAVMQITRDPVKEKQLEMMSRLPDFVRILRNYFVVEKKAALPWDDVVQKLCDSHPSRLPTDRVEEHLTCLSGLVPKWINIVNVRKRKYVKIDKKGDLKQVTAKLDNARKVLLTGS